MADIKRYTAGKDQNSDAEMKNALQEIWISGFGDTPEYFNFFYKNKIENRQAEIFYAVSDNTIVGAAYLLEAGISLSADEAPQKAYYGYAFAILPEYRGKGIYSEIAKEFYRFAKKRDAGIIIFPENGKLLQYYVVNGAVRNFVTQKAIFEKKDFTAMIRGIDAKHRDILPEDAALYEEIRDKAFEENSYLKWDAKAIRYALEENAFSGGFCKILKTPGGARHLIFGRNTSDGKICIDETTLLRSFLLRSGAQIVEMPLVTYHIAPAPHGYAGLLLD